MFHRVVRIILLFFVFLPCFKLHILYSVRTRGVPKQPAQTKIMLYIYFIFFGCEYLLRVSNPQSRRSGRHLHVWLASRNITRAKCLCGLFLYAAKHALRTKKKTSRSAWCWLPHMNWTARNPHILRMCIAFTERMFYARKSGSSYRQRRARMKICTSSDEWIQSVSDFHLGTTENIFIFFGYVLVGCENELK